MRVALPVFGEDVAPRFCFARELLVVDLDGDQRETGRRFVLFGSERWGQRIRLLEELGVKVLLCGGFNRRLQPMADQAGIQVFWGQRGEAETILEAFREGKLDAPARLQQGRGRGRGRGRRKASGGSGQGRCR
jgi:predicted Fe-Mo cluster-binding NifX family protein